MTERCRGIARMARRTTVVAALVLISALTAPALAAAAPYVRVENIRLDRQRGQATVSADIRWDADSASPPLYMVAGDVRLVAVDAGDHHPTRLGPEQPTHDIAASAVQHLSIDVTAAGDLAAMRRGNRIVVTASQRRPRAGGLLGDRAYVTVGEVQRGGSPQPHIGTEDCSDQVIRPGATLDYCDLVGADLHDLTISKHVGASFECKVQSVGTCMRRADLTGATLRNADLSALNLAGARLDGADLGNTTLDNVSLVGAEAIGLRAVGAHSDKEGGDSAADAFAADLRHADLRETTFRGVSLQQARLDGAQLQRANWIAVNAVAASFRRARLSGATIAAALTIDWSDLTGAVLWDRRDGAADLVDAQLRWVRLCRTVLAQQRTSDRDCRDPVEAPTRPLPGVAQPDPFVEISQASIRPGGKVTATVTWDDGAGLRVGELRVLAVDRRTGIPTTLPTRTVRASGSTTFEADLPDGPAFAAGNRIVLTATQHGTAPATVAYVSVATLQKGAGRGRVGMYDCSRVAIESGAPILDFCDLTGMVVPYGDFAGLNLHLASLTGADLSHATMGAMLLQGAAFAGVDANHAGWGNVDLLTAHAPRLNLDAATVEGSTLRAGDMNGSTFAGANLLGETTTFAGTPLRAADFSGATLDHTDLALTDLTDAKFVGARSLGEQERAGGSTLFLSDLTRADLTGSTWTLDELGDLAWQWSTLCHTRMPADAGGIDGDRDCPR